MTAPTIHGKPRVFTASAVLHELGSALSSIRQEDGLTWIDVGRILGKSDDQAAKYADGTAEMSVTTFYFGKREWNGRFTGGADRLVADTRPAADSDRTRGLRVMKAALAVSEALEARDEISPEMARMLRSTLEHARDAIEAVLAKGALV